MSLDSTRMVRHVHGGWREEFAGDGPLSPEAFEEKLRRMGVADNLFFLLAEPEEATDEAAD